MEGQWVRKNPQVISNLGAFGGLVVGLGFCLVLFYFALFFETGSSVSQADLLSPIQLVTSPNPV